MYIIATVLFFAPLVALRTALRLRREWCALRADAGPVEATTSGRHDRVEDDLSAVRGHLLGAVGHVRHARRVLWAGLFGLAADDDLPRELLHANGHLLDAGSFVQSARDRGSIALPAPAVDASRLDDPFARLAIDGRAVLWTLLALLPNARAIYRWTRLQAELGHVADAIDADLAMLAPLIEAHATPVMRAPLATRAPQPSVRVETRPMALAA